MLWFRACPRCSGDLHMEQNEFEDWEAYCIQCGFRRFEMQTPLPSPAGTPEERTAPRPA